MGRPYAIKNQRGASKIPRMPELVLYGIRLLAKQFLGTVLDIEVDVVWSDPVSTEINVYTCVSLNIKDTL